MPNGGYKEGVSPLADVIHQAAQGFFPQAPGWVKIRDELLDPRNPDRGLRTVWGKPKYVIDPGDAAWIKGAILAAMVASQSGGIIKFLESKL